MTSLSISPEHVIPAPDLSAVLSPDYSNKWVALSQDYATVYASAESVKALNAKLTDKQRASKPVFYKVPSKDSYYIPSLA